MRKLAEYLVQYLQQNTKIIDASMIELVELDSAELSKSTFCISFLEIEREFLASMSQEDMDHLRYATNVVTDILWVNGADMLSGGGSRPDLTLSRGLSRALMLEQPSLRFAVMDVGPVNTTPERRVCQLIAEGMVSYHEKDDEDFVNHHGLLNIGRFNPDAPRTSLFHRRLGQDPRRAEPLGSVGQARLAIDKAGLLDSIYFQQICDPYEVPAGNFVDVAVKAVSLNAKDVYLLNGRAETQKGTTALEFSGIVTAIGPDVEDLRPGDRVVVMAPNSFSTRERVPAWAVQKLLPSEDFTVPPALLTTYCTALYALCDRAQLRAGESVLIHAGAGGLGISAITIAQRIGATVYTTVGSAAKRAYLRDELGLPDSHIFNSRDESFAADVMKASGGQGVDVVLNSLTGDLMHATWDCIASFGRFVEVGKHDLTGNGKLHMRTFLRNVTFTAFDWTDVYYHPRQSYRDIFTRYLKPPWACRPHFF